MDGFQGILYLSQAVAHHRFFGTNGHCLCLYSVHVGVFLHAYVPYLENSLHWSRTDDCQISSSARSILEGFAISEPRLINLLEVSCRSTTRLECLRDIPVVHIGHNQRAKQSQNCKAYEAADHQFMELC
jgi:hypothetical protein